MFLTAGFIGKYMVLQQLLVDGRIGIAVVAMLMAVVGAGFYFRMIIALWQPNEGEQESQPIGALGTVGLVVAIILMLGLIGLPNEFVHNEGGSALALAVEK